MAIQEHIPLIEEILDTWKNQIGHDYAGYKNHVYRMINFCFALHDGNHAEREKVMIVGCFHDLGIWTSQTFAYLPPSIALAQLYLQQKKLAHWTQEIELMIAMHHKIRKYADQRYPLVEVFRQGDLVDFSLGSVKCDLPAAYIKSVQSAFPMRAFISAWCS